MTKRIILTEKGHKKLKEELDNLIRKERPKVAERISKAKDYGDLSENVEYDEAKNEQMKLEKRIAELRQTLKQANIADEPEEGVVGVGSKVTVDCEGDKRTYRVVGNFEAEPKKAKISHSSPIGKSLMGKKLGEEVEIKVPAGKQVCEVIEIE